MLIKSRLLRQSERTNLTLRPHRLVLSPPTVSYKEQRSDLFHQNNLFRPYDGLQDDWSPKPTSSCG